VKKRRLDCKYCGEVLTKGNTNREFCSAKHRVYWHREQKEKTKKPLPKIAYKQTAPESYDGKMWPKNDHSDEPKQWTVVSETATKLAEYEAELPNVPETTTLGKKRRAFLEYKIKELKKQL